MQHRQNSTVPQFDQYGNPLPQQGIVVASEPAARQLDPLTMMLARNNEKYIHLRKLAEIDHPNKPALLASYKDIPADDILSHIGQTIEVIGAIVWWSGPFTSRDEVDEYGGNVVKEGYYKVLMKTTLHKQQSLLVNKQQRDFRFPLILATSSKGVAETMLSYIEERGWYDWLKDGKPWGQQFAFTGNKDVGFKALPISDYLMQFEVKEDKK